MPLYGLFFRILLSASLRNYWGLQWERSIHTRSQPGALGLILSCRHTAYTAVTCLRVTRPRAASRGWHSCSTPPSGALRSLAALSSSHTAQLPAARRRRLLPAAAATTRGGSGPHRARQSCPASSRAERFNGILDVP